MKTLLSLVLFCFLGWANAITTTTISVDPHQGSFKVSLPANPTTGFQWTLKEYDTSLLKLTSSQYIAPESKLIGAGGEMVFVFDLLPTGNVLPSSTTLLFQYARPWETANGTIQQITINFQKPGGS